LRLPTSPPFKKEKSTGGAQTQQERGKVANRRYSDREDRGRLPEYWGSRGPFIGAVLVGKGKPRRQVGNRRTSATYPSRTKRKSGRKNLWDSREKLSGGSETLPGPHRAKSLILRNKARLKSPITTRSELPRWSGRKNGEIS